MENNELTPEKSLQIINEAIDKSRKDFERNAGTPMIFWGAIVLLFSLAVWMLLILTGKLEWNFLWFGIPVIGCISWWKRILFELLFDFFT